MENREERRPNIELNKELQTLVMGNLNLMPEEECISKGSAFAEDVMLTFGELIKDRDSWRARDISPEKWDQIKKRLTDRITGCNKVITELQNKCNGKVKEVSILGNKTSNDDGISPEDRGTKILELQDEIIELNNGIQAKTRDMQIFESIRNKVVAREKQMVRDIKIAQAIATILVSIAEDSDCVNALKEDILKFKAFAEKDGIELWQEIVKDVYYGRTKEELFKIAKTNAEMMCYIQAYHDEYIGTRKDALSIPGTFPVIDWSIEDETERYSRFNKFWTPYVDELQEFLENTTGVSLEDRDIILELIKTARMGMLNDLFKDYMLSKKNLTPTHASVTAYYYKTVLEPVANKIYEKSDLEDELKAPLLTYVMCLLTDPSHFYSVFVLM